jgi:hypothetical protein
VIDLVAATATGGGSHYLRRVLQLHTLAPAPAPAAAPAATAASSGSHGTVGGSWVILLIVCALFVVIWYVVGTERWDPSIAAAAAAAAAARFCPLCGLRNC